MKEIINILSSPVFSFTGMIITFIVGVKYIEVVGSKKFGYGMFAAVIAFFLWAMTDSVFFATISWPDNIPIAILLALVIWSTWFSIYKAVENDKRMERGEPGSKTPWGQPALGKKTRRNKRTDQSIVRRRGGKRK